MATLRQWHAYIGAFIAPSVLFFALTGTIQIFSLHEAHGGYQPYPTVEKLGRLHKDQVFALDHHDQPKQSPPDDHKGPAGPHDADDDHHQPKVTVYLLKWVFAFVALGLIVSTVFGLWIGVVSSRRRKTLISLIIAGVLLPLCLALV